MSRVKTSELNSKWGEISCHLFRICSISVSACHTDHLSIWTGVQLMLKTRELAWQKIKRQQCENVYGFKINNKLKLSLQRQHKTVPIFVPQSPNSPDTCDYCWLIISFRHQRPLLSRSLNKDQFWGLLTRKLQNQKSCVKKKKKTLKEFLPSLNFSMLDQSSIDNMHIVQRNRSMMLTIFKNGETEKH